MTFIDEIANRLVAQGVGAINVVIFRTSQASIPPGAGPYITITETGGSGPSRTHSGKTQLPTMQIMTRAAKYEDALAKARQAYNALDGVFNTMLSGTFYQSIMARQEPTDAGKDDAGRAMLSFNIEAQKSPS